MKVHIAVAVKNVEKSVLEYTKLLGREPELVIPGAYALWRTPILNLSIRVTEDDVGTVRHVGFERDDATRLTAFRDCNGLLWEDFNKNNQADEINSVWENANYTPRP